MGLSEKKLLELEQYIEKLIAEVNHLKSENSLIPALQEKARILEEFQQKYNTLAAENKELTVKLKKYSDTTDALHSRIETLIEKVKIAQAEQELDDDEPADNEDTAAANASDNSETVQNNTGNELTQSASFENTDKPAEQSGNDTDNTDDDKTNLTFDEFWS